MKQRGILDNSAKKSSNKETHEWVLFVDGAARNNPGPSGAGIYIEKNKILAIKEGYYLGIKTNNQAEYLALLLGLFILSEHVQPDDSVRIISDSLLLVQQLNGKYKVRHPNLQPLHAASQQKMYKLGATISHVLRHENTEADAMANYGVDTKQFPPKNYIAMLSDYGITF